MGILDVDGDSRGEVVVIWELEEGVGGQTTVKTMATSFDWSTPGTADLYTEGPPDLCTPGESQWTETTDVTRQGSAWLESEVRNGQGCVLIQPAVGP